MQKNYSSKKTQRTAYLAVPSLILGGLIATAPVVAPAATSFGYLQTAQAATGTLLTPTEIVESSFEEAGVSFGHYNTKLYAKVNFNGQTVQPGDYFTVGVAKGNAPTFSEPNTVNGSATFRHTISGITDTAVGNVYNGKTMEYQASNSSEGIILQPELIDSVGTPIATLSRLGTGEYVYTFNENVIGKTNIEATIDTTGSVGGQTGWFVNQFNGGPINVKDKIGDWAMIPAITQEEAASLPGGSPRDVYTFPDSAKFPYSLYISNALVTSVEVAPRIEYVKQPDRDEGWFTYSAPTRANSTKNPLSGILTVMSPRMTDPDAIGKRVTYTTTINEDTRDYLKFVMDSGADPNSLVSHYTVNEGIEINGKWYPINTDELKAKYPQYADQIRDGYIKGNNQATGTDLNANSWGSNADTDPYQLQIESITEDSIVWSYVPKGMHERLSFKIGSNSPDSVVQATLKSALESKIGNYNVRTSVEYPSGKTGSNLGYRSTWNWSSQELRYLLAALASPDESVIPFNGTVTGKDIIANDDFTNGAFQEGTLEFKDIPEGWTITATPDGKGNATPPKGFVGSITVPYTTTNEFGYKVESTWTITVTPPALPSGVGEEDTIQAGETASRDLKANDSFPESPYKSTQIVEGPANGTVKQNPDGTFTYTPNRGWVGTDTVTYTQTDEFGNTTSNIVWTINVLAPAAPQANPDRVDLAFDANGSTDLTTNDSVKGLNNSIDKSSVTFTDGTKAKVIDGIKFTINEQGILNVESKGSKNAGLYELVYKVMDAYGSPAQAKITVTVAEPTAKVALKTFVETQDANDSANPVVLAPGEKEVTFEVTNPNTYVLDSSNLEITLKDGSKVALENGFSIAPGAKGTVKGKVTLPKQGTASVEATAKVTYAYTLNGAPKNAIATASDPAFIKAETGEIKLLDDSGRVRVGDTLTIDPLENDTASSGLDRETLEYAFDEAIWTSNGDGSYTSEFGKVVINEDKNLVFEGISEGSIEGIAYTVKSNLGDAHEPAKVTVEVFDYKVALKAFVGEGDSQKDADSVEDVYEEVITEESIDEVTLPIELRYENPSETDPVTVTHFTDSEDNTYELEEPKVLAPGESAVFTFEKAFTVGEHELTFEVHTTEGITSTDPIFVEIAKEIVPNEAPSHNLPELPLPTPEPTPEVTPEPEAPKPTPTVEETTPPTAGEKPKVQNQGANTGADALAGAGILASLAGALGLGGFAAKRRAKRNNS